MATDQEIRDRGIKFLPLQKYLQNPYEFPVEEEAAPVNQGIVNTNAFNNSGGNDFSVYNPDPNSIVNRDYRPNYDYRQFSEYGSDPSTKDIKQMDINQNYFYGPPPSKLQGLLSMVPGAGIARFLGNQIGPYLPTNRRAIFENELAGQGVRVNNIGQIVQGQGDYNTAENIMAGYNASKINADTFSKRRGTIENTLGSKYGLTASQIEAARNNPNYKGPGSNLIDRLGALDASQENILGTATDKTDKIYDFEEEEKKKNKKNTVINRFITKKKEKKAAKDIVDVEAVKANIKKAEDATYYTPDGTPGGGAGQGIDISNAGTIRSSDDNFQTGDSGPTNQQESDYGYGSDFGFAKGGRAGYFFGGRVNYKKGGRGRTDAGPNRTTASKAGVGQINESGQKVSGGNFNNNNDGNNDNPPNFFVEDKTSIVDTSGLKSKSPEININYTDPKNYASLKSKIYNTNILDNDDLNVDGTLSGEIGPISYNTNFTDQGITGTNLKAGNFNAGIDANKNYNIGYANNYNGIDYGTTYDSNGNLMFNAGVKFKNGGLAGLL